MSEVIFIGGFGRSGSTLLEGFAQQRIAALGVGEIKFVWGRGQIRNERCGCGEEFRRCPLWQQVIPEVLDSFGMSAEEIEKLRLSIDRHRRHFIHQMLGMPSSSYAGDLELYRSIYSLLYRRLFEVSGVDVLIDSSKDPAHIAAMYPLDGFRSHLIHLVRDPRAVAYSFLTPKVRKEVHWTTEEMKVLSPLRSALSWDFINLAVEQLARKIPSSLLVRYEDFMRDTSSLEAFLATICATDTKPPQVRWHSVSGNPSRFDDRMPELKEDRRWVKGLGARDRRLVELATAPLMQRFGYRFGAQVD
jgi:hypothetical protein